MNSPKRRQYKYAKSRYRVKNWGEYEAGLRRRGDLTVWLSDVFLAMASPNPVPFGVRPENQPVAKIFVMSMRSHSEPSSNSTQLGRQPHSRYPTFS